MSEENKNNQIIAMDEYLNKGIKDVIQQFPEVEKILDSYNIGCAPCSVGTCLLKDIVEIHNLSLENEQELIKKIAQVIYPGQEVEIPEIKRKENPREGQVQFSPPMQRLVDEHKLIKRLLALIPILVEKFNVESEEDHDVIQGVVDFIRNYADKYHHAKEENILFKYFDENLDILKVIHQDHETARACVQAILKGLDVKDTKLIVENLNTYYELLTEHINKEDDILYPWMDRTFSMNQVGELFSKFNDVDEASNKKEIESCKVFVEKLEIKLVNSK